MENTANVVTRANYYQATWRASVY
jgi:hypothetical protein